MPRSSSLPPACPEAITASLSGLETLTVRSTAAGARFAGDTPDLKAIATEAGVDVVLLGTLLRAGNQVRVSTQLVEAPGGTVVISRNAQVALTDIFQLQDELTRQIVDALALPLSARDRRALRHDVSRPSRGLSALPARQPHRRGLVQPGPARHRARPLSAVRRARPEYAPAWARLGRVHRVMAKYGYGDASEDIQRAEEAFGRGA